MDNFDARCRLSLHDWLKQQPPFFVKKPTCSNEQIPPSLRAASGIFTAYLVLLFTVLVIAALDNGWQAFQRIDVSPVATSGGGTAIPPPETLGGKR